MVGVTGGGEFKTYLKMEYVARGCRRQKSLDSQQLFVHGSQICVYCVDV